MDYPPESSERFGDAAVLELIGKIMVVAIIILFFVVIFVFCLHLYAKWYWYGTTTTTRRQRRRLEFAAGHTEATSALRRGLDPSILKTLAVTVYDPTSFKDGLECAVCLCEVSEGEKTRLLPKCNHGFHVDCIDMWFQSHSTCPLCRNPVSNELDSDSESSSNVNVVSSFPTNVLVWGNVEENHQSSAMAEPSSSSSNRPDGITVIDIPRQVNEEEEEEKSPVPTRLKSFKRLLSGNRRVNPSSPRNYDLEQGGRSQS
ncbi:hypothetical protein BUALT_Bualt07G0171100 [Buddleja alternifolia]|uniref:RING-type E3 ubiquitin transferase n=1 Tax=Buddleja alternifolia TaxID=168488 RepID=A0AAV6XJ71_9LAMI|nr:hypothetical protein BUALT_Bualt07G0171100 [Buddleja alternifolia]